MTWVLILTIFSNDYLGASVASLSVPGFLSQQACHTAGVAHNKALAKRNGVRVAVWSCTANAPPVVLK